MDAPTSDFRLRCIVVTWLILAVGLSLTGASAAQNREIPDDPLVTDDPVDPGVAGEDELSARFVPESKTDWGEYGSSVLSFGSDILVGWPGRRGQDRSRDGGVERLVFEDGAWSRTVIEPPEPDRIRFGWSLAATTSTVFVTSSDQIDWYTLEGEEFRHQSHLIQPDDRFRPAELLQTIGENWLAAEGELRDAEGTWTSGFGLFERTGSEWSFHSHIPLSGRVRDVCSMGDELVTVSTGVILADSSVVSALEVFGQKDGNWVRKEVLVPSISSRADISSWVTCDNGLVVAPSHSSAVFRKTDSGWIEEDPIPAPDGILVVGGHFHDDYLYLIQCENITGDDFSSEEFFIRTIRRRDQAWDVRARIDSRQRLRPREEHDNGYFGRAMSFSEKYLVIAAPFRQIPEIGHGEVNVYPYEASDPRRFVGPEEIPVVPDVYAISVTSPYPNPALSSASVSVTLPERSRLTIGVFDALGRRVHIETELESEPGVTRIDVSTTDLAAGAYLIRVCVARASACTTQTLSVLH